MTPDISTMLGAQAGGAIAIVAALVQILKPQIKQIVKSLIEDLVDEHITPLKDEVGELREGQRRMNKTIKSVERDGRRTRRMLRDHEQLDERRFRALGYRDPHEHDTHGPQSMRQLIREELAAVRQAS